MTLDDAVRPSEAVEELGLRGTVKLADLPPLAVVVERGDVGAGEAEWVARVFRIGADGKADFANPLERVPVLVDDADEMCAPLVGAAQQTHLGAGRTVPGSLMHTRFPEPEPVLRVTAAELTAAYTDPAMMDLADGPLKRLIGLMLTTDHETDMSLELVLRHDRAAAGAAGFSRQQLEGGGA